MLRGKPYVYWVADEFNSERSLNAQLFSGVFEEKGLIYMVKYGEAKIVGTFLAQFWHTQPQITGESRSRGE